MEKIWKDIEGYEWIYQVNELWNIKSFKFWRETILKNWSDKNWYLHTTLCKLWKRKNFKIHRLIWIYFIENPENKKEINHINWITNDNRLENLEWCTPSENIKHAFKIWLCYNNHYKINHPYRWKFWKNHHSSIPVLQYDLQWSLIRSWESAKFAQNELKINSSSISRTCKWKTKTAGGFIWKYEYIWQK